MVAAVPRRGLSIRKSWIEPLYRTLVVGTPAAVRFRAYASPSSRSTSFSSTITNVVSRADSGGVVRPAARVPVVGRRKVARLLQAYADTFWTGVTAQPLAINGEIALGLERHGELFCVLTLTASDAGVDEILWQMNPAKLERVGRSWPTTPGSPATAPA